MSHIDRLKLSKKQTSNATSLIDKQQQYIIYVSNNCIKFKIPIGQKVQHHKVQHQKIKNQKM